MITETVGTTFTRFVQWPMEVDGYISTRGLVHQLCARMVGSDLVTSDLVFGPSDPEFTRTVGAFGGRNASTRRYHVLMHQYIPDRDWAHQKDVTLIIDGLPAGNYNVTTFWIDKTRNNWFTGWMEDVTGAGLEINEDCSLYDLAVGAPFGHEAGWSFWWNWRQAHPPVNHVLSEPSSVVVATQGIPVTINLEMNGNCVVLVELESI